MEVREKITIPKRWLHIGHQEFKENHFKAIKNIPLDNKPMGGLWASPFQMEGEYHSAWHQFSLEVWGKIRSPKSFVFSFKKNARIYVIDTLDDLIQLIEQVGEPYHPEFDPLKTLLGRKYINFEEASLRYDVIYLTKAGQARTRTPFENQGYSLYTWDCESCIVLNPHVIDRQLSASIK